MATYLLGWRILFPTYLALLTPKANDVYVAHVAVFTWKNRILRQQWCLTYSVEKNNAIQFLLSPHNDVTPRLQCDAYIPASKTCG